MKLEIEVTQVQVIRIPYHTDTIYFSFAGPTPFPKMSEKEPGKYGPVMKVECQKGFAEVWLRSMGITSCELITQEGSKQVTIP